MPSLLLVVFLVQLAIHLVNTLGATTINSLFWRLYSYLPTATSKSIAEQRQLQAQFLKVRKEMIGTSCQNEFAKWAKLRRQHDKLLEQLEKSKASTDATKTMFDRTVSSLRWFNTNGLRLYLQFWYSKQAMFWIPHGWVPYYAEWLLSFPRAPLGSISMQAWSLACAAIILLVSDALVASMVLVRGTGVAPKPKEEPMKASGEKASGRRVDSEKKEL